MNTKLGSKILRQSIGLMALYVLLQNAYLLRSKFGGVDSPFGSSILRVILQGSKEQMIWSDTLGIVTFMENLDAVWDRPIVDLPRVSVGIYHSAGIAKTEASVPVIVDLGGPLPAVFGCFYLIPESTLGTSAHGMRGSHVGMLLHLATEVKEHAPFLNG